MYYHLETFPPRDLYILYTVVLASYIPSSTVQEKFPNVSRHWKVSPKKNLWDTLDSDSDYLDSGEEEAELEGKEVVRLERKSMGNGGQLNLWES